MRSFFPPSRLTIIPQEDRLEPFVYMVHFILSRHADYGGELCGELLQERTLNGISSSTVHQLGPERFSIAVQAILLSVHLAETEENAPAWPSGIDFSQPPSSTDYPMSSDVLQSPLTRPALSDLLERCSKCVCAVATTCYQSVGNMTVLDDQWSLSQLNTTYEDAHSDVIRQHPEGMFSYPQHLSPHISVLQTCFQAWPRCLHSSISVETALDMLLRGIVHVEPSVSEVASASLKRFMAESTHAESVLSRLYAFLFDPQKISGEGSRFRLAVECSRLLNLWIGLLEQWIDNVLQQPRQSLTQQDRASIASRIEEMESGSLFLLSHASRTIQRCGAKVIRKLATLVAYVFPESTSPTQETPPSNTPHH